MSIKFKFGLDKLLEIRIEKEEESKRRFIKTQGEKQETEINKRQKINLQDLKRIMKNIMELKKANQLYIKK